uniref:Uncharacterized protein n=1 Tax=Meloidogyne hapla TaxID=6305 RepID=A0A1I8BUT4_MELHA
MNGKRKERDTPSGLRYHLQTKHDDQYQILTKKEDNEKRSVGSSSSRGSIKRFLPNTGEQIPGTSSEKTPRIEERTPRIDLALKQWDEKGEKTKMIDKLIIQSISDENSDDFFEKQLFLHHNLLILDGKMANT